MFIFSLKTFRLRLLRRVQPTVNLPVVRTVSGEDQHSVKTKHEDRLEVFVLRNSHPNRFFHVIQARSSLERGSNCLLPFSHHVKRILKINLVTLTLMLIFLTRGLLNLYFYFSRAKCDDETILLYRLNGIPQLVLVVTYPLLIMKKLMK